MTEKRPTPETAPESRRRKRAAPTIDLKATEVAAADASPPPSPQAREAQPQAAHADQKPEPESTAQTHSAPEPEPAVASGPAASSPEDKGFKAFGPALAAGVAGAVAMSFILGGLWLSGLLPHADTGSDAQHARIAALETQIQELQKRPAPASAAPAIDALTARVARMEASIKDIPAGAPAADPALIERLSAAENAMKSLGLALTALNRRSDDVAANTEQARTRADAAEKAVAELRAGLQDVSKAASAGASSADLAPLQQRIAALEQSAKAMRDELAKTSSSDKAARLALIAMALRDAALRGAPFAGELAQAKSLGAEEKVLAPLAPFAVAGVPGDKVLAQELSALLPGMLKASGAQAPAGSFIERLQANAGQLVRIRPLDAPPGDDAAAVMARIEIAAAKADIAAALNDLAKLSDARRAPAQGWIAKAASRQAALAAARAFAADTARAIGPR